MSVLKERLQRSPSLANKPSSSRIGISSLRALSSFEPASSPATTKFVFLLTEPATFPPAASMRSLASSRVRVGSVPVSTNVNPLSAPFFSTCLGPLNCKPAARSAPPTRDCASQRKTARMVSATFGPDLLHFLQRLGRRFGNLVQVAEMSGQKLRRSLADERNAQAVQHARQRLLPRGVDVLE